MSTALFRPFLDLFRPKPAKRLIIHAGTYKTGTTYFQHLMFTNRYRLRKLGLLYPEQGLALNTNHNRHAHRIIGINIAMGRRNLFPDVIQSLNASDDLHTALVSYEGFSHPVNIERLCEQKTCFDGAELHAVVVFRPHIDYAISFHRELCQHLGMCLPFKKFMAPGMADYWRGALQFRTVIEAWQRLAGMKRIHLLPYQRIKQDVASEILSAVGIPAGLTADAEVERNHSLSPPQCRTDATNEPSRVLPDGPACYRV